MPSKSRRGLVKAGVAAGAVGLGVLAVGSFDWGNPFAPEQVDRTTTPLLVSLADLDEYHAATGSFQVVVDIESDTPYVPSVISGERVQFLATGTVDAYVDFAELGPDAVKLSEDGNSATITLPAPQLSEARIDPDESRVLDRDRGLLDRVGDALGDDPTDESALYSLAEERLESSAVDSDLLERAEDGTRDMLTSLAGSLGVEDVTVEFEPAAD
ncbi:DUF4230 domain-containing protein [Blastococcus sp. TF02A-26]|uniref:DUF4230 domain-containing protein n=1 Tax=Blastococcus sp. TF02A-26 TaxID=2250577 RepID=UPI000DE9D8DB|nr:DUF4230 domain-containing protein [Blastococcus sp. TF02A-26]RBY85384.1 DUF4230 domain-containing protein [Blastococcus sp. TF02A-26]